MHGARYGPCEAAALQERMKRAVALLGKAEVEAILEKEGRIEVRSQPSWESSCLKSECVNEAI